MPKGKKSKSKKDASSRGVRKHLRELERQLTDAARQEIKRVRKLEKSRNRRQELQAAVEQLRIEAGVATPHAAAPVVKPDPKPVTQPAVKPAAQQAPKPAATGPAPKPAAARAARTPRAAAAKPAVKPATRKPSARAVATPKPKGPTAEA